MSDARKPLTSEQVRPVACPKCGSGDISTTWHPASDCSFDTCTDCHHGYRCKGGREEHLQMTCRGCGHVRYQAPLDAMGVVVK